MFYYYRLYIKNLKYAHLTLFFLSTTQYPFSILYLPPQIQMDIVYREPCFKREFSRCTKINIHLVCLKTMTKMSIRLRDNYEQKLSGEIIRKNYDTKLSGEIMTRNYQLVYYIAQKCVNYRDTCVSKNDKYVFKGLKFPKHNTNF